jgi:5-methylcytosine-specific restriction endonuclease McrA
MWRECFKLGVAAICYSPVDDLDLSEYDPDHPPEEWAQLFPSQKASIRRLAYEMRKGDVIYVKQGPFIVGRGTVLGPYAYKLKEVVSPGGYLWPHQRPVSWQTDFAPVRVLLGGELNTVLKLTEEQLRLLGQSKRQTAQAQRRTEAREGELLRSSIRFRRRNKALIKAKWAECGSRARCEACSFRTRDRYGPSVKEMLQVHHRNPLAENQGVIVTTLDDLVFLCPNCHRALHSSTPAMTVGELKGVIR